MWNTRRAKQSCWRAHWKKQNCGSNGNRDLEIQSTPLLPQTVQAHTRGWSYCSTSLALWSWGRRRRSQPSGRPSWWGRATASKRQGKQARVWVHHRAMQTNAKWLPLRRWTARSTTTLQRGCRQPAFASAWKLARHHLVPAADAASRWRPRAPRWPPCCAQPSTRSKRRHAVFEKSPPIANYESSCRQHLRSAGLCHDWRVFTHSIAMLTCRSPPLTKRSTSTGKRSMCAIILGLHRHLDFIVGGCLVKLYCRSAAPACSAGHKPFRAVRSRPLCRTLLVAPAWRLANLAQRRRSYRFGRQ